MRIRDTPLVPVAEIGERLDVRAPSTRSCAALPAAISRGTVARSASPAAELAPPWMPAAERRDEEGQRASAIATSTATIRPISIWKAASFIPSWRICPAIAPDTVADCATSTVVSAPTLAPRKPMPPDPVGVKGIEREPQARHPPQEQIPERQAEIPAEQDEAEHPEADERVPGARGGEAFLGSQVPGADADANCSRHIQ